MLSFARRFPSLLVVLLSLVWSPAAPAKPGPARQGAVQVELIAGKDSIQPGRPFWVALKLDHDAHWHTYWINSGTGYPTSLTWQLPEGFKAGDIVWPVPHVVKDTAGVVTGHGYEGQALLFVEITPPANPPVGQNVTLRAKAEWLMCKDVCMPGEAEVELTLPVRTEAPHDAITNARNFNNRFAELPRAVPGWTASATRDDKVFTLRLTPTAGNMHRPGELHFFDNAGLIDYAAPQTVVEQNGAIVITLKAAADAPADAKRVAGVLVSQNGWGPLVGTQGNLIDVPIESAASTAKDASPQPPSSAQPLAAPKSDRGGSALNSQPAAGGAGLPGTLLLAFIGGLILNLMPCVFPVLGIKVLGFVNQSGSERSKIVTHGFVFTFGVLLSFWVLAGLLLALRAGGQQLGWGAQLQFPPFVFGMATFLLIFALNLSGLFEVGLSATSVGANLQMKQGYAGSFFTGALAVLVATPCSAPFLAPALGAAFSSGISATESMLIFTCIGLGLSAPYLLLSAFPAAVKFLPRPGAWMETFKQFMAFPLYATVGWLLWVLAAQTSGDDYALLLIVFGLVLVAMAAWLYGRFGQAYGKPARQTFGRIAALVLLVAGVAVGWPKEPAPPTAPDAKAGYQVVWEKWSPDAVRAAQAAGKFVYVDFTARWCATCQTNKAAVFHSQAVLDEFAKKNVVLLRGDWTNKDPQITAELARWNRSAVPFNLIYAPTKPQPIVLPELLTPDRVLAGLAEIAK